MSLYNMVCGHNPYSALLLYILRKRQNIEFERLRDTYVEKLPDGHLAICVTTRCGGGNRADYMPMWVAVHQHKDFIDEADDSFDNTFATARFRCPEHVEAILLELSAVAPLVAETPSEKFDRAMAGLENRPPKKPLKELTEDDKAKIHALTDRLIEVAVDPADIPKPGTN